MSTNDKMKNALPSGTRLVTAGGQAYTLVRVLGIGGFGITYLGTMRARVGHITVDAQVAIKEFFPSSLCERRGDTQSMTYSNPIAPQVEGARKSFLAEARRLNSLAGKHGNIVAVNEVFEANNTVYYVMEYIAGESLKQYVEQNGPMSEAAMLTLMRPVVEAVAFLHGENITHLDIKPANIMLGTEGAGTPVRPTLIDFGLSKHYDEQGGATSTLAGPGFSEGYAPREQYRGITTFTPAADVYALGATMLYCLTGRRLPSSLDLTDAEVAAAIPATVGAPLRSVLIKALALHKDDRTPDAGALLRQLDNLGSPEAEEAPPVYINIEEDTKYQPFPISAAPVTPYAPKPVEYEYKPASQRKQPARDPEVGIVENRKKADPVVSSYSRKSSSVSSKNSRSDSEVGVVARKFKLCNWLWITTLILFIGWFIGCISCSEYEYFNEYTGVWECISEMSIVSLWGFYIFGLFIVSWILAYRKKRLVNLLQLPILYLAMWWGVAIIKNVDSENSAVLMGIGLFPFALWVISLYLTIFPSQINYQANRKA